MKVVIRDSVVVTETGDGGVVVNAETREELRLDRNAMTIWKALAATGTMEAASQRLHEQSPRAKDELDAELGALVAKLADLELIRIVDGRGAFLGRGRLRDSAFGRWVGRSAFGIREWAGWWLDARFDRRFGTDTSGIVEVRKTGVQGPNARFAIYYEATPTRVIRRALRSGVPAPEGYVFVDYGSGKGRTLLVASEFAFKRIIGVELSWKLHATAQQNIRVYRGRGMRCTDVTSICCDAAEFELPANDLVLYFYTPFHGPVFDEVLERIKASFALRPRRLIILAYSSRRDQMAKLSSQPFVTRHREIPLRYELTRVAQRRLHVFTND